MRCCGSERTTPYCPSCGKNLLEPSPLVSILKFYRGKYTKLKGVLEKHERYYKDTPSHSSLIAARKEEQKMKLTVEALEEAMNNLGQPAKVMSDWLKENGYEEAGKALLGAFTGVPS